MQLVFEMMRKDIRRYALLTVLLAIIMVSEAYILQMILEGVKLSRGNYLIISVIVLLFLLVQTLIYYVQQSLTSILSKKSASLYRRIIFEQLQKKSLSFLAGAKHDHLLPSLTSQIDQLEYQYFYSIYWGSYLICQLVVAVIISLYMNPLMAMLTILLSLPNLLITVCFKQILENNQDSLINVTTSSVATIQDVVDGITDWKVARSEKEIYRVFEKSRTDLLEFQTRVEKSQYFVVSLNQLFSNLLYFGSWLVGGWLLMNSQLSMVEVVGFSQLLVRVSYPVYASSDLLAKYINGNKILHHLNEEFLTVDSELQEVDGIANISFEGVRLRGESKHRKSLDMVFYPGQKYLLRGRSGSGKTRLLKAILKEEQVDDGTVRINGVDVLQLQEESIFDHVAYVSQNPHLFSATLRDNLTLFSTSYTDDQLYEVLHFVELSKWANEVSLAMTCSNDSIKLSGGEIKRLALARAILLNKDVLLLDEFSSGVDEETLVKIEEKLARLDKLIIYITHVENEGLGERFSTIVDLDLL